MNTDLIYPPWKLVPEMDPGNPDGHGVGEAYILMDWLRSWQLLRPDEQEAYLDDWNASPAWRTAIRERYEQYPVEVDRDAIRAVRMMRGEKAEERHSWWRRLRKAALGG